MQKEILDGAAINRALTRIAHEIIEHHKGTKDLVILGIKTRGVPLADRIVQKINTIEGVKIPLGQLDITFYRDDLEKKSSEPMINSAFDLTVEGKIVIIVDDVIFTGRTCRAAIDAVLAQGRADQIQLVALIDRGHRELPISANYIGKNVPTSKKEMIQVMLTETDGQDHVLLTSSK